MKKNIICSFIIISFFIPVPSRAINKNATLTMLSLTGGIVMFTNKGRQYGKKCITIAMPWCPMAAAAVLGATTLMGKRSTVKDVVDKTCRAGSNCSEATEKEIRDTLPTLMPPDMSADGFGGLGPYIDSSDYIQTAESEISGALSDLQKAGYTVDRAKGTIKMPDGRTLPIASIGNPSAMAAAGMSSGDIDKIQKEMKDMNQAAKNIMEKSKTANIDEDDGGGKGRGAGSGGSSGEDSGDGGRTYGAARRDTSSEGVAGLTRRTASGEQIGVSSDNIFHMVNRRYTKGLSSGRYDPNLPPPANDAAY